MEKNPHVFGKHTVVVEDDIAQAAVDHLSDIQICGSVDLTEETISLTALLFSWCRTRLEQGSRPIPIQQALRATEEAMADPDGVGIRIKKRGRRVA